MKKQQYAISKTQFIRVMRSVYLAGKKNLPFKEVILAWDTSVLFANLKDKK